MNEISQRNTHLNKSAIDIVRNSFDLHLLMDKFILYLINSNVQSLNVHLRSFCPGFCQLQSSKRYKINTNISMINHLFMSSEICF